MSKYFRGLLNFLRRFGFLLPRSTRSFWIHGETPRQFDTAMRFIHTLSEAMPQFRLLFTSGRRDTVEWLRTRCVDYAVTSLPWNLTLPVKRFFKLTQPSVILLLDSGRTFSRVALHHAGRAGIPVIALNDGEHAAAPPVLAVTGSVTVAPDHEKTLDALTQWFQPVRQEPANIGSWKVDTWRDRAGQSAIWKAAAPALMKRRIDNWSALRSRLQDPESILCLGNGPSSEDPRVLKMKHDCLMRVNWRWKLRGILANPDLVFVGDPLTLTKLPARIFAFWNIALEYGMLLRYFVTHGPRRMEYMTLERMSPLVCEAHMPARPTNGALMVVAAAALQPKRLIIAGIDLYLHPDGRYPGDSQSLNQYAQAHLRSMELALIHSALRKYQGELIVLSDILRDSLAHYDTPLP